MAEFEEHESGMDLINPAFLSCEEITHELFIRGILCEEEGINGVSDLVEAFHTWKSAPVLSDQLDLLNLNAEVKAVVSSLKYLRSETAELLDGWSDDCPVEADLVVSRFVHCILRTQRCIAKYPTESKLVSVAQKLNGLKGDIQKVSALENLPAVIVPDSTVQEGEDAISAQPESGDDSEETASESDDYYGSEDSLSEQE